MMTVDKVELRRLAEAFPDDLDWDSNHEPFFNGPSGESLGGGADGTYAVYGKPFRLDGEDYDYDGPTYVERCGVDFAKFMVKSRGGVLSLLDDCQKAEAERDAALAELEAYRKDAGRYSKLRDGQSWPAVFGSSDDPEPIRGAELDAAMDLRHER